MSLSSGIVGLPNVGKSTLFNALLRRQVALAANYPFATIEPNTGIVPVPDKRLDVLAKVVGTTTIKPATVEFVDIAGLVKGASEGEGLGNQFLANIREVDLICHVLRGFTEEDILREGSVNPLSDREIVETELLLADLSTLEKQKQPKATKEKSELERWEVIESMKRAVQEGKSAGSVLTSVEERAIARELGLLSAKKVLYVINVSESDLSQGIDALTAQYATQLQMPMSCICVISAKIESELSSLDEDDQMQYLKDLGMSESGLERLIRKAYELLELQSFLTAGEKEVRAWTIPEGATAVQAAGVIHTDFSKKFIKAKVASYQDFVDLNGWKMIKETGKLRTEGREYVMRPDDVVEFAIGA
ncbi:MAG: redox-regulated ATPase YchF [Microgenomates group bacterium]